MAGTGGGKGERLTDTQNTVLTMLETQNSDIICGIPTGFESSFVTETSKCTCILLCFPQNNYVYFLACPIAALNIFPV